MRSKQLVDAEELASVIDQPDICLIDCRFELGDESAGRRGYLEGHLPGAVYSDLNIDLAGPLTSSRGRHPLPEVGKLTTHFRRLGIDSDTRVVVYDAGNGAMAVRCWWLLRWLGHPDVRLLNGGVSRWRALDLALETGLVSVREGHFRAAPRDELIIETQELLGADIAAMRLFDARDRERFEGLVEPIDRVAGHIPGARNQPFSLSLASDGRFKSDASLATIWAEALGADRSVEWAVMCGSGVTACHLALSGLQAGYREPRLYVGSWSEWIRDPSRPIATGSC